MSDLVGNPEDQFSHNEAHIKVHTVEVQNIRTTKMSAIISLTFKHKGICIENFAQQVVVVVLGFYVVPTAKIIQRRLLGLKSHPKDWRSPGSNSRPLD